VVEAIRAGAARDVLVSRGARHSQGLKEVLKAAERAGVPVREVPRAELDALHEDHRGVAARLRAEAIASSLSERDLQGFAFAPDAVVVVLDGVEDPQNLGAAARSAEAAGVTMLVTRTRRAAPVTPAALRASAGAMAHLPHARVANIARAIERLQGLGFVVAGLDAAAAADVYAEPCPSGRLALVVGSEGRGLSRLVRERCDLLVSLPMRGDVESLNASASLAAVLYAWVLPSRMPRSGG
jgi:23S rRNA (guanosine2251-2'-O)-methyltransferase